MNKTSFNDEYWMAMAVALAGEGVGLTRPNPPVGAVVVRRNHRMVGMGYHQKAGRAHAEVLALRDAGTLARGATLYVTLEPCSTYGRTPPCTNAIIESGIKRVVYGCTDPNPAHTGRADKILKKAGILVTRGIMMKECGNLIAPFAMRVQQNRPFVTLKLACTLDGRISDGVGASRWITGKESRLAVQALRRSADGIMVGAETVRLDNPSLLPKPAFGRTPLRIVLAGRQRLSPDARLFTDAAASRTVIFASAGQYVVRQKKNIERNGARLILVPSRGGMVSIRFVLRKLAEMNCMHVVCEGGGTVASTLIKEKLVDRLCMFYAPMVLGGRARPSVGGEGWKLAQAPGFDIIHTEKIGADVLVVAIPGMSAKRH